MVKINSVLGKMTGKVGNIVVTSVGGEVIAREYNPNVANPNTAAQQNTRSKFKLASQLSAAMAPVIAIKKEGNVSARNLFVKTNFDSIRYSMGVADINLNVVQLTKSQRNFAGFNADRSSGSAIAVELNADSAAQLTRVVYIGYKKLADGSLQLFDSKVCNTAGADGLFADALRYDAGAVVLYAYGMKDLDAGITSKFGNLNAPTAEDVAQLLVTNTENMSSVQLTKTAGLTMAVGEDTGDSDDIEHITVSVVTSGNGSAAGGGRFEAGQMVTLRATPDAEASFEGWHIGDASGERISTANPYSFTAEQNITICAKFLGGPVPSHSVLASVDPQGSGSVTGAGVYSEGTQCTLNAVAEEGYHFVKWTRNGQTVSTSATYQFEVTGNTELVANFAADSASLIDLIAVAGTPIAAIDTVADSFRYDGTFAPEANGKAFAAVSAQTPPEVGAFVTSNYHSIIDATAASLSGIEVFAPAKCYFVVGTQTGNTITVEEVYPIALNGTNVD